LTNCNQIRSATILIQGLRSLTKHLDLKIDRHWAVDSYFD